MPKKFTILSAVTALSISTLNAIVPTFADVSATYTVADIADFHSSFVADMKASCGDHNNSSSYRDCRNSAINRNRNADPGRYAAMSSLDQILNGVTVSAYNPYAGTLRFYIDDDRMASPTPLEYKKFIIFWVDNSYANKTQLNAYSDMGVYYAGNIGGAAFSGKEVPEGVHIVYKSSEGEENWYTSGTEQRIVLNDESNFLTDSYQKQFFLLGYDSDGGQYLLSSNFSGAGCQNLPAGSECQTQFYYTSGNSSTTIGVGASKATTEDLALIERREIIKATEAAIREAEERAITAEAVAREAEEKAAIAEAEAEAAKAAAASAKSIAATAKAEAESAKAIAEAAEANARNAEAAAEAARAEAETAKAEVEAARAEAESLAAAAREAEAAAREAEAAAKAAEERANQIATESALMASEATKTAEEAKQIASDFAKIAKEGKETAEKSTASLAEITKTIAELNTKIADLSEELNTRIAAINKTATKVTEIKTSPISSDSTPAPVINYVTYTTSEIAKNEPSASVAEQKTTETPEILEATPDDYVETPLVATPGKEEPEFPWWIIAFTFSGIALILWWFIPARKKQKIFEKSLDK